MFYSKATLKYINVTITKLEFYNYELSSLLVYKMFFHVKLSFLEFHNYKTINFINLFSIII